MKLALRNGFIFVLAGVVYFVGQYFRGVWINPAWPHPCHEIHYGSLTYCDAPYLDTLGWPLIVAGEYLAVIGLILLFANTATFKKWFWLSLFYVPLTLGLILWMYPIHTPLGGEATYSDGVRLFGNLYVVITLGLVLWGVWKNRRKNFKTS